MAGFLPNLNQLPIWNNKPFDDFAPFGAFIDSRKQNVTGLAAHQNATQHRDFGQRTFKLFGEDGLFQPKEGTPAANSLSRGYGAGKVAAATRFGAGSKNSASFAMPPRFGTNAYVDYYRRALGHRPEVRRRGRPVRRRASRSASRGRRTATALTRSGISRSRIIGISRSLFSKASVFPPSLTTKIVTSDFYQVTAASQAAGIFVTVGHFRLNSALDPVVTPTSTQQGLWFDQLKALYRNTMVHAAKLEWQIITGSTNASYRITQVLHEGDRGGTQEDQGATADPTSSVFVFMAGGEDVRTQVMSLSRYVSMKNFFRRRLDSADFMEHDTTPITTANACDVTISARRLIAGTAMATETLQMRFQVTQWITFSERIKVADS